ncbi:MAG TPA: hypothetical protein DC046_10890 [Rhodospirillaceae bacterium]|nr:hypothetical protein [Rhodospirillaceae bacterium]
MVEVVSGSGIARILSYNEVQEDRAARQNVIRAADARDRRLEIRAATLSRSLENETLEIASSTGLFSDDAFSNSNDGGALVGAVDERSADGPARRPNFADMVADPQFVNDALEDMQGIERRISREESRRLSAVLADKLLRTHFISMIDPGRAMTMLSPRDIARPLEEDG